MTSTSFIRPQRSGGILLEVVLSISLFTGAAAFTLASVRSVFDTLDRSRRMQQAVDIARSKMAELEIGLITLSDLQSFQGADNSSVQFDADEAHLKSPQWLFDVRTFPTEFTGLILVELTAQEDAGGALATDESDAVHYTLRQLISVDQLGRTASSDTRADIRSATGRQNSNRAEGAP